MIYWAVTINPHSGAVTLTVCENGRPNVFYPNNRVRGIHAVTVRNFTHPIHPLDPHWKDKEKKCRLWVLSRSQEPLYVSGRGLSLFKPKLPAPILQFNSYSRELGKMQIHFPFSPLKTDSVDLRLDKRNCRSKWHHILRNGKQKGFFLRRFCSWSHHLLFSFWWSLGVRWFWELGQPFLLSAACSEETAGWGLSVKNDPVLCLLSKNMMETKVEKKHFKRISKSRDVSYNDSNKKRRLYSYRIQVTYLCWTGGLM